MMAVCCRYVWNRVDAGELLLDGFYKFFTRLKDFRFSSAIHDHPLSQPEIKPAPL